MNVATAGEQTPGSWRTFGHGILLLNTNYHALEQWYGVLTGKKGELCTHEH